MPLLENAWGIMTANRKLFTIEQNAQTETADVPLVGTPPAAVASGDIHQILTKLDDLGNRLVPTQTIITNIAEAYRREVLEVVKLRDEMQQIQNAIQETKRQVVSLHSGASSNVTVNDAAGELGAVVIDTESATNKILGAAEHIEMLAGVIQSEVTVECKNQRAGEIATEIMAIYEACNFQDLTGQRIARVCETLEFVESKVSRMADIWGGLDSLSAIMASELEAFNEERMALGTHGLAVGPAMAGSKDHVGQDDIDALFD
jgi:chemotaxis protein CheZ